MRVIEIVADTSHFDTLAGIAAQHAVADFWYGKVGGDGRQAVRMLVDDASRQAVIDALQSQLGGSETARIIIMPVDAVLPRKEEPDAADKAKAAAAPRRVKNSTAASSVVRTSTAPFCCWYSCPRSWHRSG